MIKVWSWICERDWADRLKPKGRSARVVTQKTPERRDLEERGNDLPSVKRVGLSPLCANGLLVSMHREGCASS